ncbi:MAG TPA: isopentenyl phosphate kinase [Anaerolineales bacterium]|nr:isopentenyl phosphate kinase [Anaerolineales bacterium]
MKPLVFLKLGGSLITDKSMPHTARPETLARLAGEIAAAWAVRPGLRLVIGHGSGSFGHVPAKRHGTRQGVSTPEQWRGFAEVWQEAHSLNQVVMAALQAAGLPAVAFAPSAAVLACAGQVESWDLRPLQSALEHGLLPVVYGDVVFDTARGGTILSTEDLFEHLALRLRPERLLLAGLEPGVWADYPACTRLLATLTPTTLDEIAAGLGGSHAADVTGGMASKVRQSLALVQAIPGLDVLIFSGEQPGSVQGALEGAAPGTCIRLASASGA